MTQKEEEQNVNDTKTQYTSFKETIYVDQLQFLSLQKRGKQ